MKRLSFIILLLFVVGIMMGVCSVSASNADELGKEGYKLGIQGKWSKAIEVYNAALEVDPTHAKIWYNKGIALNNLQRYEEAIDAFDQVIRINPEEVNARASAWFNKGMALQKLGRYEEAIEAFDQQLKINPNSGPGKTARNQAVNKLKK